MALSTAILPQLLVDGLIAGAIYSLVASGFSLIYASNRFVNFAQGGFITVAAFVFYSLFSIGGVPLYIAIPGTIAAGALVGALVYYGMYRVLKHRKAAQTVLLIASVGVLILLENIIRLIFGSEIRPLGVVAIEQGINILGAHITPIQLIIIGASIALMVGLLLFMRYTKMGAMIRAVSDNEELAKFAGINTEKIQAISFIAASAIAGCAAVLIAIDRSIEPAMGVSLMIDGFTGAVVGGMGSVPGSIVGSYVVGTVENLGQLVVPSGYKNAISFVLLILFLLVKPTGIFGINKGMRDK